MRPALRVLGFSFFVACFTPIEAPECTSIADCPPGYTSCQNGYCFKGKCDTTKPVPNDGCCAEVEGDRSEDTDCLVMDIDLKATALTVPASDGYGSWFVSGVKHDATGHGSVWLWKIAHNGDIERGVEVGGGSVTVPAVISTAGSVYAAYDLGVMRYEQTMKSVDSILSGRPTGGLCATLDKAKPRVAWVTEGGVLVIYSENDNSPLMLTLPETLGRGAAFAPVVSGNGRRMYVLWKSGVLLAVEVKQNPLGPIASTVVTGVPVTPPTESGGVVFTTTKDGVLTAYRVEMNSFQQKWTLSLGGEVAGRLLVDSNGALIALMRDGTLSSIRDNGDFGTIHTIGSFGEKVADLTPVLCQGRVIAVSADGRTVVSLRYSDKWLPGLRFSVPVGIVTPPSLDGFRLVYGTASGRLVSWVFTDAVLQYGFAKEGSDPKNRGTVVVSPQGG